MHGCKQLGYQASGSLLTDTDNIELETTLQELALNLRCDAVETDVAARVHRLLGSMSIQGCHCCEIVRLDQRSVVRSSEFNNL